MFDSSSYNLSNPAFTDDIGMSNMNRMLPMAPATFAGGTYFQGITGTRINGKLSNDIYQPTRKQRDKSIFKKILLGAGVIAASVLCFKGGKKAVKWIKNLCTKIATKFKK